MSSMIWRFKIFGPFRNHRRILLAPKYSSAAYLTWFSVLKQNANGFKCWTQRGETQSLELQRDNAKHHPWKDEGQMLVNNLTTSYVWGRWVQAIKDERGLELGLYFRQNDWEGWIYPKIQINKAGRWCWPRSSQKEAEIVQNEMQVSSQKVP